MRSNLKNLIVQPEDLKPSGRGNKVHVTVSKYKWLLFTLPILQRKGG
jgi:hypothetical protein